MVGPRSIEVPVGCTKRRDDGPERNLGRGQSVVVADGTGEDDARTMRSLRGSRAELQGAASIDAAAART